MYTDAHDNESEGEKQSYQIANISKVNYYKYLNERHITLSAYTEAGGFGN